MEEILQNNWLTIAVTCVQVLWGWLVWTLRKQFVSAEEHDEERKQTWKRLEEVESGVATLDHRLDMLERDVRSLPEIAQRMDVLIIALEKLSGRFSVHDSIITGLREDLNRIESQYIRIDSYLRESHK